LEDNHEQRKATVTPAAKKLSALLLLLYALTISFFTPLPCTANKKIRTDPGVGAVTTNDSSSKPERQQPLHSERTQANAAVVTQTNTAVATQPNERSSLATQQHAAISQHKRTQQSQRNNQQYLPTDPLTRRQRHRASTTVPPCQATCTNHHTVCPIPPSRLVLCGAVMMIAAWPRRKERAVSSQQSAVSSVLGFLASHLNLWRFMGLVCRQMDKNDQRSNDRTKQEQTINNCQLPI
jgi:hypothetical protein